MLRCSKANTEKAAEHSQEESNWFKVVENETEPSCAGAQMQLLLTNS